jgi:hypothetical protein
VPFFVALVASRATIASTASFSIPGQPLTVTRLHAEPGGAPCGHVTSMTLATEPNDGDAASEREVIASDAASTLGGVPP